MRSTFLIALFVQGCSLFSPVEPDPVPENDVDIADMSTDTTEDTALDESLDTARDVQNEDVLAQEDTTTNDVESDVVTPAGWPPSFSSMTAATVTFPNSVNGAHDATIRVEIPVGMLDSDATSGELVIRRRGSETDLPFAVDSWNPNGTTIVWLKVAQLTSGTTFELFFDGDGVDHSEQTAVWDNHELVLHFNGTDTSSVPVPTTYTSLVTYEPGLFDQAGRLNGGIVFEPDPRFDLVENEVFTVDVWVFNTFENVEDELLVFKEGMCRGWAVQQDQIGYYAQGTFEPCATSPYPTAIYTVPDRLTPRWRHVVSIYDLQNDRIELIVDGELVAMVDLPPNRELSVPQSRLRIGSLFDYQRPFTGLMDELRIYRYRPSLDSLKIADGIDIVLGEVVTR